MYSRCAIQFTKLELTKAHTKGGTTLWDICVQLVRALDMCMILLFFDRFSPFFVIDFAKKGQVDISKLCWPDGKQIEAVDSICLLGIPIDNDLKMSSMVEEKVSNGFKSLWFIKRLQSQGVKQKHLVPVYRAYVQSKIEYGLAPFAKMLTAGQIVTNWLIPTLKIEKWAVNCR